MNTQTPAIPAHIWEADQTLWRGWLGTRSVTSLETIRTYKRHLTVFYQAQNCSIRHIDADTIASYEETLRAQGYKAPTIKSTMATIKSYWLYAREAEEGSDGKSGH